MAIQIDTHQQIADKTATPARQQAKVPTEGSALAVGVEGTADRRLTRGGPMLRDLVGDWTWRSHPDDQQLRPPDADPEASTRLIRALATARLLVGY